MAELRNIVVVGSGLGGLTAALHADALGHSVTLLTKGALDESNSRYAQGGIAAAVFDDDTVELHVEDTLAAGAGLSVLAAVEALCGDGPLRIADLVRWGVRFDGDESGFSRGLEAAHSRARVLHAGGDATGRAIVLALIARLAASRIQVVEHAYVTDLLITADGEPRVAGLMARVGEGAEPVEVRADAVVLATGGAGQLFEFTTNPAGATADGLAAAWRAGARVDDLEFYQFHPTALAVPGSFLISEAVRGEGAVLLDAAGRRFMTGVDRRAELAPRDVVARGIARQMALQAGLPVHLDATALGRETLEKRFPTITRATRAAGLDWAAEPIPVTPAAHYFMGGISTDLGGRTSLPGLYAVGEVASTGIHGANRLASNSLLEAAVFGWRAIEAIAADEIPTTQEREVEAPGPAPTGAEGGGGREFLRPDLQHLMWSAAGVERSGETMLAAAATLAGATAPTDDPETTNLLDVARLVLAGALAREESRGAHYRADFPFPSDEFAHAITWTREVPQHAH